MVLPLPRRVRQQKAVGIAMTGWNRAVRGVTQAMTEHLGGADFISIPESLIVRRVAVFEAELNLMEEKIARDRHAGIEPSEKYLDLYSRLANGQRRFLETVGLKRVAKDVTPSLTDYIRASTAPAHSLNSQPDIEVPPDETPTSEPPSQ